MKNFIDVVDPKLLEPQALDHRYKDSPFKHLKNMQPKVKGARFEKIVESVYKHHGKDVRKADSTDYDRLIDGVKVEIKGSTLVNGADVFSFLQIRPKQNYDMLVFAMFYPDDIVLMEMSKSLVEEMVENGSFGYQHGGKDGNSGTYTYYGNEETLLKLGAKEFTGV